MCLIEELKKGNSPPWLKEVAENEKIKESVLIEKIIEGKIVVPYNWKNKLHRPIGIGEGLRTKINSNIGTSPEIVDYELEVNKAKLSERLGVDTIMDLSTGGELRKVRKLIRKHFKGPMGTVPIYEAAIKSAKEKGGIVFMTPDDIFTTIEEHAQDGVDFITVHCGVTWQTFNKLKSETRIGEIVSRGASFLLSWMVANKKENPLYEEFDRLLDIAYQYNLTLSLGDGFRPGAIGDATDRAQIQELIILGELKERANKKGVQVMIEGPGHLPLDEIETNIKIQKKLCHGAPFYVLGPIVTDIAPGYDEITSSIGGAIASAFGADFICYVTPSEHIGLPTLEEVRKGIISAKIAAHAGDIVKGIRGAKEWDNLMSKARKELNWEEQMRLAVDKSKLKRRRKYNTLHDDPNVCTMCGKYCAIKLMEKMKKNANITP